LGIFFFFFCDPIRNSICDLIRALIRGSVRDPVWSGPIQYLSELGVLYSFRFDFFPFGNSYGRLSRRKCLLIPFVSISLFFCRSNWMTEVDFSNRKTAFHRLSTFSAASIRALVRPRASSYRFSALSTSCLCQ